VYVERDGLGPGSEDTIIPQSPDVKPELTIIYTSPV
jgi:hypothetical protein